MKQLIDIVEEILSELIVTGTLRPSRKTDGLFDQLQDLREEADAHWDGDDDEEE